MTRSPAKLGIESDISAVVGEPLSTRQQVFAVLRLGRYTGETEVLSKDFDETVSVLFQVVQDCLHQELLTRVG
jgi:hypothetical protein